MMLIREVTVTLVQFIEGPKWCVVTELVRMCGSGCMFVGCMAVVRRKQNWVQFDVSKLYALSMPTLYAQNIVCRSAIKQIWRPYGTLMSRRSNFQVQINLWAGIT